MKPPYERGLAHGLILIMRNKEDFERRLDEVRKLTGEEDYDYYLGFIEAKQYYEETMLNIKTDYYMYLCHITKEIVNHLGQVEPLVAEMIIGKPSSSQFDKIRIDKMTDFKNLLERKAKDLDDFIDMFKYNLARDERNNS